MAGVRGQPLSIWGLVLSETGLLLACIWMSFPPAHAALQALLFLERVSPAHQSALEAGGGGSAATGTEVPVLLATGKTGKNSQRILLDTPGICLSICT